MQELGWNRSDVVISTKIFFGARAMGGNPGPNETGLSRKHLIEGIKVCWHDYSFAASSSCHQLHRSEHLTHATTQLCTLMVSAAR